MNALQPLIHIRNFHLSFGTKKVIDGLSFDVHRGETFGFLGSNGSGKTTTIRALLGTYCPTSGTVEISEKVFNDDVGARLGYLPKERGLHKKESVRAVMNYVGRLTGMSKQAAQDFRRQYLDRVALVDFGLSATVVIVELFVFGFLSLRTAFSKKG